MSDRSSVMSSLRNRRLSVLRSFYHYSVSELQCKLQSTAQRLAEVESLRELWRTECENQRQLEAELESKTRELCERNQGAVYSASHAALRVIWVKQWNR